MKKVLWMLMDDRAGSRGQARGVIRSLGPDWEVVEKQIVYNSLAKLPNWLRGCSRFGLDLKAGSELSAPWPDAVLSISRRTVPVARWIKKQSCGRSRIIQLMYPGSWGLKDLDLVIISEHDRKRSRTDSRLFYITGCPHRISEESMREAREIWDPRFADLPRPWISVIIGGAIKNSPFSERNACALADKIRQLHRQTGGSILITTSRRTGAKAEQLIKDRLAGIPAYTYWWGEQKENPIMGYWACGDYILVTGDTVSMCCESCGSGKPVLIFCGCDWLTRKHLRFVQSLFEGGYAVNVDDPAALDFKPRARLDPADLIGDKINTLF